jgi:hypothetical protein
MSFGIEMVLGFWILEEELSDAFVKTIPGLDILDQWKTNTRLNCGVREA